MARATREDIVTAAAATFAENGWHGATLAAVGARLGLSKSAVLYHFDSKDALLDEVLRPVAEDTRTFEQGYDAPPEGFEARMSLLRGLMEIYARHYDASLALRNDRLLWTHSATGRAILETYSRLVDLLSGSGDAEAQMRAHTAVVLAFRAVTTGIDLTAPVSDLDSPEGELTLRICADVLRR